MYIIIIMQGDLHTVARQPEWWALRDAILPRDRLIRSEICIGHERDNCSLTAGVSSDLHHEHDATII